MTGEHVVSDWSNQVTNNLKEQELLRATMAAAQTQNARHLAELLKEARETSARLTRIEQHVAVKAREFLDLQRDLNERLEIKARELRRLARATRGA